MMRRRTEFNDGELEWDTETVSWFSPSDAEERIRGQDLWMLAEDLGLELWGQFNQRSRQEENGAASSVVITNCSESLRDMLMDAIPDRFEYQRSLASSLAEVSRMVAMEVILEGALVYVLSFARPSSKQTASPVRIAMRHVPQGSLVQVGRRWAQMVPANTHGRESEARIIPIDHNRVVRFAEPASRRSMLMRMRSELLLIEQSRKDWMSRALTNAESEIFGEVNRNYSIAIAHVTREIGWYGRGLFQEYSCDFHWATRRLRWYRFCIEFRDEVIATLNKAFIQVGRVFGERPELIVRDLPTLGDVKEAERMLEAGPVRFDVLMKPFLKQ